MQDFRVKKIQLRIVEKERSLMKVDKLVEKKSRMMKLEKLSEKERVEKMERKSVEMEKLAEVGRYCAFNWLVMLKITFFGFLR